MRKLTREEVLALQDGAEVHVRLRRLCHDVPTTYEGKATLYVQTHNGQPVVITVRDPLVWAEADPRHGLMPDGSLVVEDYEMEIFTDA